MMDRFRGLTQREPMGEGALRMTTREMKTKKRMEVSSVV
jgi:hypothetical protein